jgi:Tol biopolymer transport system component
VQPFFSPDSRQVLYLDKPSSEAPTGIYGIDVTDPAATPELVTEMIGYRSPDRTVVATIEGNLTRFLEEGTGQSWTVETGGNRPHYAPDGSRIIWSATDLEGPYDRRRSDIWLAELDGNNPQLILSVVGGGFVDWMPDGQHILVLNRADLTAEERTLVLVDLANDQRTELATEKRLRGVEVSPDGSWIAYFLTFADEPEKDGIWVVSADGSERFKLDVPGFGGYRWRDNKTLLLIPMRSSAEESMQLWEVEVEANISRPLSDPTGLSFSISNGDWEVSPDGRHVIFVNSLDQNIWLITLP